MNDVLPYVPHNCCPDHDYPMRSSFSRKIGSVKPGQRTASIIIGESHGNLLSLRRPLDMIKKLSTS